MLVGRRLPAERAPVEMVSSSGQVLGLSSWGAEDQEAVHEAACRDVVVSRESRIAGSLTFWSK